MATTIATLKALLTADTADFDRGMKSATTSLKNFDGAFQDAHGRWRAANGRFLTDAEKVEAGIKKAGMSVANFGKELERAGTALSIGLTAPLVLLGKQIVDIGFAYEKSMNTFQAVTRASTTEMAAAAAMAQKLGADMTLPATSAADAALAMTELAKGGLSAAQAMDAAKGTLQLAAAAMIDEAKAAEITSNALNTFGLSASEAGRVADLLAAASNASSAEITDLAQSLQQTGSSAAALKIPIEDTITAIGLMANAGIRGSDAGTSMKTALAALTPTTKDAAAALKQLGIDAFDSQGNFVGLEKIIQQAAPALGKMSQEMRTVTAEAAFGSDGIRFFNTVIAKGVDTWNDMSKAVAFSGAAAELAAAKTKGLAGAWDGFISQLETVGLKVFNALAPSIESVVRKIADMAAGLGNLNPEVLKFGATVAGVAGAAGPLALLIGKLATLGPGGAIVAGVIAGAALMAGAYTTNFGQMQSTVDDFFARFNQHNREAQDSAGAFGTFMSKWGVGLVAVFDQVLVSLQKIAVNLSTAFQLMQAASQQNWAAMGMIWANGRAELNRIDKEFDERHIGRMNELHALEVGGVKQHWAHLRQLADKGVSEYSTSIVKSFQAADPFGDIARDANGKIKSFTEGLRSQGALAGLNYKSGWDSTTKQSPFFMIHDMEDAAGFAIHVMPDKMSAGAKKIATAFKKAFKEVLGDINDLFKEWGAGLNITEDIAKKLGVETKKALQGMSQAHKEHADTVQALAIALNRIYIEKGQNIRAFVENGKIQFRQLTITVEDSFARLQGTVVGFVNGIAVMWPKAIKQMHIDFIKALDDAKFAEAMQRKVTDIIDVWVRGEDKLKEVREKASEEQQKQSLENSQKLKEIQERLYSDLQGIVGRGMADIAIIIGKAFGKSLAEVNKFSTGLLEIIDGIPGKMGDKLREGANKVLEFVNRIDSIFRGLHKIFNSIPDGLGPAIERMVGIVKGGVDRINTTFEGVELPELGSVLDDIQKTVGGASGKAGGSSGESFAEGFLGKLSLIASGVATFFGTRGQGKVAGVLGGAMAGAQIGTAILPGLGTAIGAGVGAIAGLFGTGKSREQKEAEERAKKEAALRTEEAMLAIQQSILDVMSKGFELLEKLEGFTEVPRKAIKRFVNQLSLLLTYFVDEMKSFNAEAALHSKTISESLTSGIELMLGGLDLINGINEVAEVTDAKIQTFVATVIKIAEAWVAGVAEIELGVAKRAGKISEKLQLSFAFLRVIPETLEALVKASEITLTDEMIAKPIADARRILEKFFDLAEDLAGMALNRATKASDKFKVVFENAKIIFESIATIGQYKPIEEAVFDGVKNDFVRILDFIDSLIGMGEEGLSKSETLGDVVRRMAESLGASLSGISALAGGGSSGAGDVGSQGFAVPSVSPVATPNVPAGASSGGSSSGGSGSSITFEPGAIVVQGSMIEQSRLTDTIMDAIERGTRGGRFPVLASV
jgi:TP901 family phage tail tape measure protein